MDAWLKQTLDRFASQNGQYSNCAVLSDEDGDVHYVLWMTDCCLDEVSGDRVRGDALVGYLANYISWEDSSPEKDARLRALRASDLTEPSSARLAALEKTLAQVTATPCVTYCPLYMPALANERP
jgi:hypothetical protein